MKICSRCHKELPLEDFAKSSRYGYQAWCKKCNTEAQKEWRQNNDGKCRSYHKKWYFENKDLALKTTRKRDLGKYGISEEDYDKLFEKQKSVCAICGKPETRKQNDKITLLCVDHDHETGVVRGLLCHTCNIGIGMLNSTILLERAKNYLNDESYHIEPKEDEEDDKED